MGYIKCLRINDKNMANVCPLLNATSDNMVYNDYISLIKTFKNVNFGYSGTFWRFTNLLFVPDISTKRLSCDNLFYQCEALVASPNVNTSYTTNFNSMFYGCKSMIHIPDMDTSKGVSFANMFCLCYALPEIPLINTSNGIDFDSMFGACYALKMIPVLDISKATSCKRMFWGCTGLIKIEKLICTSLKTSIMQNMFDIVSSGFMALEDIIIEGTIKVDSNDLDLHYCPNLTVDSLMSFINAFEDNTGEETQYTVTIGATNLAKLTPDQIAIATNKNILLA